MIAALRWARASGAARVVAAVPVAAAESIERVRFEADDVVCLQPLDFFFAVGAHYDVFRQVDDDEVTDLIAENRRWQALREAPPEPVVAAR
jgi:predicted phosphoribosyltransferase